jgi:hypothetical protein
MKAKIKQLLNKYNNTKIHRVAITTVLNVPINTWISSEIIREFLQKTNLSYYSLGTGLIPVIPWMNQKPLIDLKKVNLQEFLDGLIIKS